MNKIVLEIELTGYDLDLASQGITSALALLEVQGYTDGGMIHAVPPHEKLPNRVILTTKYRPAREFLCTRSVSLDNTFSCEELPDAGEK